MAVFEDLGPIDYFGPFGVLRAVGWLGGGSRFSTGDTAEEDFDKLCSLLVKPWQPGGFLGWHDCDLCQFGTGPKTLRYGDHEIQMGISNLFVPASDRIFVAPSLIAHYIDCHRYKPPAAFVESVRACPKMASMKYKKALLAAGGRELVKSISDKEE